MPLPLKVNIFVWWAVFIKSLSKPVKFARRTATRVRRYTDRRCVWSTVVSAASQGCYSALWA
jgi:hypothetical protein